MQIAIIVIKNLSHIIFLLFATSFSCANGHAQNVSTDGQTENVASTKTQGSYESEMKNRRAILLDSVSKNHAHYDSLIFEIYDGYKQQYLRFGGEGQWAKALPIALACESTFMGEISPKEEADLIYNIAYISDKNKQYLMAVDYYNRSIARYETLHEIEGQNVRDDLALAYNNLGVVHANTGFFTERKASYLKAKELWESANDVNKSNLISLYGNLLRLYRQYGDKQAAKVLISEVNANFDRWIADDSFGPINKLETKKPKRFYYVEKHRLNILYTDLISDKAGGILHLDSLRTYFKKMSFVDQKRFAPYLLTAISGAAGPLVDYDSPDERKKKKLYLDMGMQESILYSDRYNEMIFHSLLVSYNLDAEKDVAKALWHLDEAIQIGHEMYIREFNLINLYLKKGDVLQQTGQFLEAEKLVLKGMSVLLDQPITDPAVVQINDFAKRNDIFYINVLKQVAGIYKSEYESKENPVHGRLAQHFYDLAARLFHVYYQKGAYNPWLNMTNKDINEGLLSLHLALEATNDAALVNMMENNRSQHLSKEFEAKYLRFLNVPDYLFTERNLLQTKVAGYDGEGELKTEEYQALQGRLLELESEIQQTDSNYFSFFTDTLNIQKVKAKLQEGEYIVRYALASENLYAYTIHKDNISVVKLGEQDSLLQKVEQYHEALKTIQNDYIGMAKRLYIALIAPLQLPLDKIKNLVIIPDNKLNFIPFETLVHPDSNRPLVSLCPISYSHGFKLWLLQQKTSSAQREQQWFAAFAPQYSTDYMATFVENKPVNRNRLQDIAGATKEAVQLTDYFDGNLYQGEQATKQDFLQRSTDYKIYHFAMHALLDESDHLNSSLVFQDGEHLQYHELYSLHFPAELVVLSACNTGMGKLESGEGLMSLSRALTYSGVRSSVYSLWEVPDEETAEVMLSFYGHLKSGLSKVEALTLAKRDFLANNPLKSHPFFWAGFVINGNTDSLNYNTSLHDYIWIIGGGVLILMVLLVISWKRRQGVKF